MRSLIPDSFTSKRTTRGHAKFVATENCCTLRQKSNDENHPVASRRLFQLRQAVESGVYLLPRTQRALQIAEQFKVSISTAYRHIARGTEPERERREGHDGKFRPAGKGALPKSAVTRELLLMRQALNRADAKACHAGIYEVEISTLRQIYLSAGEILNRWEEVRHE